MSRVVDAFLCPSCFCTAFTDCPWSIITLAADTPDRLMGYPVFTDPNVAAMGSNARIAAFADMSTCYVRQVGNPVIELDRSIGFAADETYVRGKHRIDGDLVDLNAVTSIVMNV